LILEVLELNFGFGFFGFGFLVFLELNVVELVFGLFQNLEQLEQLVY
jgi:hypothetical protein